MIKTYEISGMKCEGCAKTVKERFQKVAGVEDLKINLADKSVQVEGQVSPQDLAQALAGTNYSLI
ncbi:heavy metal-associated domain-containing protein [Streptococcaceae bacterium ESL0729]|nr:heavy metal-associated domain-containing protein [Streptococcaceae bacterium ESL0729]